MAVLRGTPRRPQPRRSSTCSPAVGQGATAVAVNVAVTSPRRLTYKLVTQAYCGSLTTDRGCSFMP